MIMSLTSDPCERWEELGFGRSAVLYRRAQVTLEAARLLPAHRRLPRVSFLSGLWRKLLSVQPARILMCLPYLQRIGNRTSAEGLYAPREFHIEGFSAGSYIGAVMVLAIRVLFPECRTSAKLGAIAMPKGVFAALLEVANPGQCNIHLIHAEEDTLCDWQPSQVDRYVMSHRITYTLVAESDKWMGANKHKYWHWLRCQLPAGRYNLTDLKLSHPDIIPVRDRMAAPLRLASWIRFETVMHQQDWIAAIEMLVPNIHLPDEALLRLLCKCAPDQGITSMEEAQALLLRNFRVGGGQKDACAQWLTDMTRALLAPIPFREVFVILALFLPQLPFAEGARLDNRLWASPAIRRDHSEVQITPLSQGLRGMREYRIAFTARSRAAAFCPPSLLNCSFEQLTKLPPEQIHIGCQVGKVYRMVLRENHAVYALLVVFLEFVTQPKKSKQGTTETYEETAARQSSPRSWVVAFIPFPETFAPLPTQEETGMTKDARWMLPPSMKLLEARTFGLQILSLAEVGNTVSADHLLQMATMPLEHKTTALGIPYHHQVSYLFDGTDVLMQSLHSLFGLLVTGNTPRYCPQASQSGKDLCVAARTDSAHIISIALSLASALQTGRSTLAVAGVLGAGKTRSLTFLLAWIAITANLKVGVVQKENPAGRAITKLLTSLDLAAEQAQLFDRPVGREEADANTACTPYDRATQSCAAAIPKAKVVIATTGLVWEQKGQLHSPLRVHMESVDLLISEEAQRDMDLKSAFVPAVPRQPFFRILLGDPKQRLEGLPTLSRTCRCPNWVRHQDRAGCCLPQTALRRHCRSWSLMYSRNRSPWSFGAISSG